MTHCRQGDGPVTGVVNRLLVFHLVVAFVFDGSAYVAPVVAGPGNWNLRIKLRAPDGTLFQQRVIVAHVAS